MESLRMVCKVTALEPPVGDGERAVTEDPMSVTRGEREKAMKRREAFEQLERLLQPVTTVRPTPKGTVLFRQGEAPEGVYFVLSGSVEMKTWSRHPQRSSTYVARPGEILGLGSAFSGKPSSTTAEVITRASIGYIARKDFFNFFQAHPEARLPVLQLLSDEVNSCYDVIRSSVRRRAIL
jgi:CRP-like cAMP-binding protein